MTYLVLPLPVRPLLLPRVPQQVVWQRNSMTLVLRLTELELCRLESRGWRLEWFAAPLVVWDSRESVTIGMPSLPVTTPRPWATLSTLRMWSLACPVSRTSRRQLTTISLTPLPPGLRPTAWTPVPTLGIETLEELLTQTGVPQSSDAVRVKLP